MWSLESCIQASSGRSSFSNASDARPVGVSQGMTPSRPAFSSFGSRPTLIVMDGSIRHRFSRNRVLGKVPP